MAQKDRIMVRFDPVHLKLLDDLQPFFGNSRPEVIRTIVLAWLQAQHGIEGLRAKKAVR